MSLSKYKILRKLTAFGVIDREQAKNDLGVLSGFLHRKLVKKIYKRGRVFYELTEKALPFLDAWRQVLFYLAQSKKRLYPKKFFYKALTEDLRFLDTDRREAREFLFLGDWQLTRKPVSSQLKLSQLRYYQTKGLA